MPHIDLRLDPSGGLSGALEYTVVGTPELIENTGYGAYTHTGQILYASRGALGTYVPLAAASYEGAWEGRFFIESCAFTGWQQCYREVANEAHPFDLTLSRTGDELAGELRLSSTRVPVTGRIDAAGLELQGTFLEAVSGGQSITRLIRWTSRVDACGRMNGTFTYARDYLGT